jgi:hypothetical protein
MWFTDRHIDIKYHAVVEELTAKFMTSKLVVPSLMLKVKEELGKRGGLSLTSTMVTFTGTEAVSGALVWSEAVRTSEYHAMSSRFRV